jgi:hypothetical protein
VAAGIIQQVVGQNYLGSQREGLAGRVNIDAAEIGIDPKSGAGFAGKLTAAR